MFDREFNDRDREAIRSVVQLQLEAFQRDDADAAFAFASPGIQEKFGTSDNFFRMVKQAYPVVHRPRSVLFDSLILFQGMPTQQVLLLTSHGEMVRALYLMEQQPNQTWRIIGCYLMPLEEETP